MPVSTITVYSTENRLLGTMAENQAQDLIQRGLAKLIRSRDGHVRELHMIDCAVQDTGLEEVRSCYLSKMVKARTLSFQERLYRGEEWTGLRCWTLKGCSL